MDLGIEDPSVLLPAIDLLAHVAASNILVNGNLDNGIIASPSPLSSAAQALFVILFQAIGLSFGSLNDVNDRFADHLTPAAPKSTPTSRKVVVALIEFVVAVAFVATYSAAHGKVNDFLSRRRRGWGSSRSLMQANLRAFFEGALPAPNILVGYPTTRMCVEKGLQMPNLIQTPDPTGTMFGGLRPSAALPPALEARVRPGSVVEDGGCTVGEDGKCECGKKGGKRLGTIQRSPGSTTVTDRACSLSGSRCECGESGHGDKGIEHPKVTSRMVGGSDSSLSTLILSDGRGRTKLRKRNSASKVSLEEESCSRDSGSVVAKDLPPREEIKKLLRKKPVAESVRNLVKVFEGKNLFGGKKSAMVNEK